MEGLPDFFDPEENPLTDDDNQNKQNEGLKRLARDIEGGADRKLMKDIEGKGIEDQPTEDNKKGEDEKNGEEETTSKETNN